MKYYPIFLNIRHRSCLVVGAGAVGARKVDTLLACGARVTVISPQLSEALEDLHRAGDIEWKARAYAGGDLAGYFLVIGATDDAQQNQAIYREAEERGIPCNIVDQPRLCSFILPSLVRCGDLVIAVSTSGRSPALAKKVRIELEKQFGDEYALFLAVMGAVREKLLSRSHAPEFHKPLFEELVRSDLLEHLRCGDHEAADELLTGILGEGFDLHALLGRDKGEEGVPDRNPETGHTGPQAPDREPET